MYIFKIKIDLLKILNNLLISTKTYESGLHIIQSELMDMLKVKVGEF